MAVTPNDPLPVAPEVVTGFFRAAVCRANHPRFFGFCPKSDFSPRS